MLIELNKLDLDTDIHIHSHSDSGIEIKAWKSASKNFWGILCKNQQKKKKFTTLITISSVCR